MLYQIIYHHTLHKLAKACTGIQSFPAPDKNDQETKCSRHIKATQAAACKCCVARLGKDGVTHRTQIHSFQHVACNVLKVQDSESRVMWNGKLKQATFHGDCLWCSALQMTLMSLTCPQDLIKGSSICTSLKQLLIFACLTWFDRSVREAVPTGLTAENFKTDRKLPPQRHCGAGQRRQYPVDDLWSVRLWPVNHVNRKLCHVDGKLCFDILKSVLFSWKGTAKETTVAGALLKGIKTYEAKVSQTPRLLIFKAPSLSSPFEKSVRLNRASQ